jgi:hypothetical protein
MATMGFVAIVHVVSEAAVCFGFTFEGTLPQPTIILKRL